MKESKTPLRIKEEDGIHKNWKKMAKIVESPEGLEKFVRHLKEDFQHDYGTAVHAIAAAMIAAYRAVDSGPGSGITGFQAGCLAWEMIDEFMCLGDGPKRIFAYRDMLYPQYKDKFTSLSKETWEDLQEEARKKFNEIETDKQKDRNRPYWNHLKSIVEGTPPFGFTVEKDENPNKSDGAKEEAV